MEELGTLEKIFLKCYMHFTDLVAVAYGAGVCSGLIIAIVIVLIFYRRSD